MLGKIKEIVIADILKKDISVVNTEQEKYLPRISFQVC